MVLHGIATRSPVEIHHNSFIHYTVDGHEGHLAFLIGFLFWQITKIIQ